MSIKHIKDIQKDVVKSGANAYMQMLISSDEAPNFIMRKFTIEPGGEIPLHTNIVEHEQYVLGGRALIKLGNKEYKVKKGDIVFIPANVEHSYKTIGSKAFEFLCIVPKKQDEIKLIK